VSDPKSYTDIGGGGPYPPHGEDFFDRIVNVHWPKKLRPITGGVFIAGESGATTSDTNIYYMRVGAGADLDPTGKFPVWRNLGTLDFGKTEGDSFTGDVQGSAYGLVGGKSPVFVLVGGGGSSHSVGTIMASRDGLNWSRVFTLTDTAPGLRGVNIFGVVWDGAQFWAGGHLDINYTPVTDPFLRQVDILLHSLDGFSWGEVARVENVFGPVTNPDASWSLGEYKTGFLAEHCSGVVVDSNGNGVPGGNYGYIKDDNILLAPTTPQAIDYFSGGVDIGTPDGVSNLGANVPFPVDPGLPTLCTATAGGVWVYAGGVPGPSYIGMAAVLLPSPGESGGVAWQRLDPPGSKLLVTLCGGAALAPPA
jgi:hypothetical protein